MTYSPLPWTADPRDPLLILDADGRAVGRLFSLGPEDKDRAVANAQLILSIPRALARVAQLEAAGNQMQPWIGCGPEAEQAWRNWHDIVPEWRG